MPSIIEHQSRATTKLLIVADSGAGKTGGLASLAAAGYRLYIADLDNGLDVLRNYVTDPASPYVRQNPRVAENVFFQTLTDPKKDIGGQLFTMKPTVWTRTVGLLKGWQEKDASGAVTLDLGPASTWGEDVIFVVDSLSALAAAAQNYDLQMNALLGKTLTQNEARRAVGRTQNMLRSFLEMIADDSIKCNVIVTSHITLVTESGQSPQSEDAKGETFMGYPSSVGRALSPHIPRYFNTMLSIKAIAPGRHQIYTKTNGVVLAKNTAPMRVKDSYDLSNGLAEYFKAVRAPAAQSGGKRDD